MFQKLEREMKDFHFDPSQLPELAMFGSFSEFKSYLAAQVSNWHGLRISLVRDGVPKRFRDDEGRLGKSFEDSLAELFKSFAGASAYSMDSDQSLRHANDQSGFQFFELKLSPATGFADSEDLASLNCAQKLCAWLDQHEIDIVVASGSGSLTDVAKHAAFLSRKKPALWSLPSALTVTAFTSAFAVLETDGYKKTYPSLLPSKTLFLNFVTKCAPLALRQAGVGDLLAGFTSYADWYLSNALGFSSDFLPQVAQFMMRCQRMLRVPNHPEPLSELGYNDAMVSMLSELLAAAGLAMNLGRSSAPQSGGEHATSHALDWLRNVSGRQKWRHGTQVALTALSSCAIFDWIRSLEFVPVSWLGAVSENATQNLVRELVDQAPYFVDVEFLRDVKKRQLWLADHEDLLSSELSQAQAVAQQKASQWAALRQRFTAVQQEWPTILAELASLTVTAEEYFQSLQKWGLPEVVENMEPPGRLVELRWALRFAVFYRERFGVQDFAFWLGEDPAVAAAL